MPLAAILATITTFLPDALAGYFLGKGMDKILDSKETLKDELQDVIQDTITEYSDADLRNYGHKLPFYHSVSILEGLLKFRIMAPGDYDTGLLLAALQREPEIVSPTKEELDSFFSLFMSKISKSEALHKLEIKETYSEEIFTISRKITKVSVQIDNLAQLYTGDLELQWKDRVDTYVKALQDFKPATALKLIESLERSLQTSSKKPAQNFMAFLEFQKGQCLGFLGRTEEQYRAKLKAWGMDPNNTLYCQTAAICLFRLKDTVPLTQVITDVLSLDPFNPIAWALQTLSGEPLELKNALISVPVLVRNDSTFNRVLYNEANPEWQMVINEEGLVPSCLNYVEKEVTIDGYSEAVFWINLTIKEIFGVYYLDCYENNQMNREKIALLNRMLSRFLEKVRGSELKDNFERLDFLFALTEFSLNGNTDKALELELIYSHMLNKQQLFAIQAANALQLCDMEDRAIQLLKNEPELNTEALLLLLYSYKKKDDMRGYCETSKKFASSIEVFESRHLLMYLNLMVESKLMGQISNFIKEDFVSRKIFTNEEDGKLVNAVATLIFDESNEEVIIYLSLLAKASEDAKLVDILGSAFFAAEAYEIALNILARNIDGKFAGRELYQYIHAYNKTGKDYKELLKLLENWRLNSPFSAQFCRLEARLRQDLVDRQTVVVICEYYLDHLPNDSAILALYANSLHLLNSEESNLKLTTLPERANRSDFQLPQHLVAVCDILFLHGMHDAAFELLYPQALDPASIELRAAYVKLVFNGHKNLTLFKEYEAVELGYFVKYEREGKVDFIEINDAALNHPVYQLFLGKAKGEAILARRKLTNLTDTFIIIRVMNKYLALFEQVLHQAEEDPYAGLPFSTIKFNQETSILETMQSMFGDNHRIAEQTKDADFNAYYSGNLSLSELISKEYDQKFIHGYYNVIRYHKGISSIQRQVFANHVINADQQMVLDYGSLLLFYQIWVFHQYNFPVKFILSKYVVERIRFELGAVQYGNDRFDTFGIEVGRVAVNDPSFDFLNDRMTYLIGLLEWIDLYCEIQLSDQTIEFIKKTGINVGENHIIDAAMSTLLLVTDDANRLLITDDSFSLRMNLLPIERMISSEHYLKSLVLGDTTILDELVRNRYIGYSPNANQLSEEYIKLISGKYSSYSLLLDNLSLLNSRDNLNTVIEHLKEIALKPMLTREQIIRDMTTVLVSVLQVCKLSFIEMFAKKVFLDFALLGERQNDVIRALHNARNIILASKAQPQ